MPAKPARLPTSTIAATAPAFRLIVGRAVAPVQLPTPANDLGEVASFA